MTPLAPINGTAAEGLRVLPDGTLLAGSQGGFVSRYRTDGSLVAKALVSGLPFFAGPGIAISADATYARIGGSQLRYDLATNTLSVANGILTSRSDEATSMAVYGGWTAARGFASYASGAADHLALADVPVLTPALLVALALALVAVAIRARL